MAQERKTELMEERSFLQFGKERSQVQALRKGHLHGEALPDHTLLFSIQTSCFSPSQHTDYTVCLLSFTFYLFHAHLPAGG